MRTHIIQIGNSKGVRIPHAMMSELGLEAEAEVDLSIDGKTLVISRARRPREDWEARLAAAGPQTLLDPPTSTTFDERDWKW
jgi:antitoxin MazE